MRFGLGPPVGKRRRRHSSLRAATVINSRRFTLCPVRDAARDSSDPDDGVFCLADRELANSGADVDALAVSGARRPAVVAPATIFGQTTGRITGPRTAPAISGPLVPGGVKRFGWAKGPQCIPPPTAPAQNMDNGSDCTVGDLCEHVTIGNDVISGVISRRSSDVMLPSSFCMISSPFCCCCCCCWMLWLRFARLRLDDFLTLGGLLRAAGGLCATGWTVVTGAVSVCSLIGVLVVGTRSGSTFTVTAENGLSRSAKSVETGGKMSSQLGSIESFLSLDVASVATFPDADSES